MDTSSPFLHRGEQAQHRHTYVQETDNVATERARARLTLERLRYHWWIRRGTLAAHMQRLGDFGRKHFGFFDPRQTGGGWW